MRESPELQPTLELLAAEVDCPSDHGQAEWAAKTKRGSSVGIGQNRFVETWYYSRTRSSNDSKSMPPTMSEILTHLSFFISAMAVFDPQWAARISRSLTDIAMRPTRSFLEAGIAMGLGGS